MDSNNDKAVEELQKGMMQLLAMATKGCIVIGGTVAEVHPDAFTCDVNTLFGSYVNVPLSVLKGSQGGDVKLPVVGTDCLITFKANDSNRPQMFAIDGIDKWYLTANEILFNNGTVGIPVSTDLVDRMNNLESAFNAHTHILTLTSGTGTAAPTASPVTPTVLSDIASTKVFNDS